MSIQEIKWHHKANTHMYVFQLYENANCKCKFGHSIISHKTTKGSMFEKNKRNSHAI